MMVTNEGKRRIGDQQLGVLFDGGKVRCRREWRGVKDTLYDYGRWLYILSLLAKFIVKPRNIKAMFRYRWMSNYLAVPHMVDKFTMVCAMRRCASSIRPWTSWSTTWPPPWTISSAATAAPATTWSFPTAAC